MKFLFALILFAISLYHSEGRHPVLLISFDGFRFDYPTKFNLDYFKYVQRAGVTASEGMTPMFVTLTVPNHVSIATGLYEETHGVISYKFYDPATKKIMSQKDMGSTEFWDKGDPIWNTARRQGRVSAVHSWAGSQLKINGLQPTIVGAYKTGTSLTVQIDSAIDWITSNKSDLVMIYNQFPDLVEHQHAIDSEEVQQAVKEADQNLGYLLRKLIANDLLSKINLILISDHGFTDVKLDEEHLIFLNNYINNQTDYDYVLQVGAVASIYPKEGMDDVVFSKLKDAHPKMQVFKKEDIPDELHYKKHPRIPPLIAIAEEGYYIDENIQTFESYTKKKLDGSIMGDHGYKNDLRSMKALFLATGPDFKRNYKNPKQFSNVNIYPLLCHLLDITPDPNDGNLENINHFLKP